MKLPPTKPSEDDPPESQLIPLEDLLSLAEIDEEDIEAAILWWDDHASEDFKGALDE